MGPFQLPWSRKKASGLEWESSELGLVPASFETGEANDRKGHITHQGPARVRFVLNCGGKTELSERTVDETEEDAIDQPLGFSARLSE